DADERCDFDQTALEVVDEAVIEAATGSSQNSRRKSRVLPVAVGVALMLGVLVFAINYAVSHRTRKTSAAVETPNTVAPVAPLLPVTTLPSPSPTTTPTPSAAPSPKTPQTNISTAHTRATPNPVSTSGPGIGAQDGRKPVILLTSGAKIEADEVWRTRDGVWYRRNGMVTLLKPKQVKTIVTR
ncbi:MAG TPA: hypothetical protein VF075_14330, partial [Pyrinomonadaceae bacterium]